MPERKQVAVLFADVCGSTQRIANADPEEARSYLERALSLMEQPVRKYEGTIARNLGDGVLALFGAPSAQENYVLRACQAGQEIQRRTREANAAIGSDVWPITVRVGIDCGEAVVSCTTDFPSHYRADGVPVHVAKRLEEIAAPGSVLVSAAAFRQIKDHLEAKYLETRNLSGLDFPTDLYELAIQSPVAALARRNYAARLVGRSELLAAFTAIADQVRASQLRCIGLRGEAGVGKSRLIAELCQILRGNGYSVYVVAAHTYTSHVQYAVAADLIRELLPVPSELSTKLQLAAVQSGICGDSEAERMHRAAAVDVLGLGDPGEDWSVLTPVQRRRRISETLHWLVRKRIDAGPLLIVIEDVQHADRETLRLLEQLLRRIENLPVLLCLAYREEFQPRWTESAWYSEHSIRLLERSEIESIAREILGHHPSIDSAVQSLVDRAEGNPFYLEQMAMTLIDDGTLIGLPGDYVKVGPDVKLQVPPSIAAVIGARIDRLPAAAKVTLEAAAVVGDPISPVLLAAMQELPREEIEEHFTLAAAAGLLTARTRADGERHAFRHSLVQEVVVRALTRPRKVHFHRAALEALRLGTGTASPDQSAVLAHHAYNGESWPEAAAFALQSMSRSITRSANRDALRVFELGMDAARRIPDEPARRTLELGLLTETLGALLPLGRVDEILDHLERAGALAKQLGDTRREAVVLLQLAVMLWTGGKYAQGLQAANKASDAAVSANSRNLQMAAAQARMMLNHGLGRYAQVFENARQIEQQFPVELSAKRIMAGWAVMAAVNVKVFLADVLALDGRFDAAQEACDAAYRELGGHEHAFSRVLVDVIQGRIWIERGLLVEAIALLQAALESCQVNDVPTMVPPLFALSSAALALNGQAAESASKLRKAIDEKLYLAGGRYNEFYLSRSLAIALVELGNHEGALAAAVDARKAAVQFGQRGHEAEALFAIADIKMRAGQHKQAVDDFALVRDLARECSMGHLERKSAERMVQITATHPSEAGVPS